MTAFNITQSQSTLAAKIASLEPFILGLHPSPDAIEGRAKYIKALTKLVAEHVEEAAADVSANQSFARVDEEDARGIADIGSDIAGQVMRAADAMEAA